MPDVYISRAGMESKALDEKFTQTELSTVKTEVDELRQTDRIKGERLRQMEEAMRLVQSQYAAMAEILSLIQDATIIEAALKRKRAGMGGGGGK